MEKNNFLAHTIIYGNDDQLKAVFADPDTVFLGHPEPDIVKLLHMLC